MYKFLLISLLSRTFSVTCALPMLGSPDRTGWFIKQMGKYHWVDTRKDG